MNKPSAPESPAKEQPEEVASMVKRLSLWAASKETAIRDTGVAAFIDGEPAVLMQISWLREAAALLAKLGQTWEQKVCPHCGLSAGVGYGGVPLCRQPWGGSPEAKPHYPSCLLTPPSERP